MHLTIGEDLGSMKYGKTKEKQQNDECKIWEHETYVKERGAWGTEEEPRRILKNWQNVLFSYLDIEYIGICFTIILQTV